MRCDRSWSVFVLCVIARLIAWPSALYAQEVTDLLNEAHEQYEQSLEQIERDAITRLDELIDQYSDEGNLKKVLELRAQKTKLLEDRDLPPLNVTTFRERISGGANQGRARDATREEVHCGTDHWEAPRV
jgi:hypothetical protein